MTVAPQADTETVTGLVQGIVQKAADKWQIEVNVGQQNPRRLWTKDAELVQQMMGMIGQQLSFMCGKSHWQNQSGQPVTSLWINGYGQPGQMQQAQPVQQQPAQQWTPVQQAPQQQPVMQQPMAAQPQPALSQADDRELKIHRQTATKVAVQLLKHLQVDDQNFTNLLKMSERLVAYYENGAPGMNYPLGMNGDDLPGNPIDGSPPHTDDDIPF